MCGGDYGFFHICYYPCFYLSMLISFSKVLLNIACLPISGMNHLECRKPRRSGVF
ncbi:hypothetical protein CORMATOL_00250 [Corynebacterium matruchotii ATCC 33806]|uniref:Uncharacterized protein n=1 Tax=Corynebacterium matruchotii ATCC 33806 TaxID=566549 RepID=C0DZV4_9CORY|nr:hypothetical protein CORMATOL_00250 [Corynebacterium matruchotii ATCC 33806]